MKAKVKRCPFCNSHNLIMERSTITTWIKCHSCFACGPLAGLDETAVKYWNEGMDNPDALVVDRHSNRDDLREVDLG